jgi:hypothetical protein
LRVHVPPVLLVLWSLLDLYPVQLVPIRGAPSELARSILPVSHAPGRSIWD